MDLTTEAPGWVKFNPIEDVQVEIRRINLKESLDLNADLESEESDGEFMIVLPPGKAQGYFKKYVRNIKGLKVNGQAIKKPDELLDPSMASLPELKVIYGACVQKFFAMNVLHEDEAKNSKGPSEAPSESAPN